MPYIVLFIGGNNNTAHLVFRSRRQKGYNYFRKPLTIHFNHEWTPINTNKKEPSHELYATAVLVSEQ
jgi:hypothetical protein